MSGEGLPRAASLSANRPSSAGNTAAINSLMIFLFVSFFSLLNGAGWGI